MSDSCYPTGCSLPGSSIHEIFQARVLEWVAISFTRGSFRPRDRTRVSRIVGRCFTVWETSTSKKKNSTWQSLSLKDASNLFTFNWKQISLIFFLSWNYHRFMKISNQILAPILGGKCLFTGKIPTTHYHRHRKEHVSLRTFRIGIPKSKQQLG